VISGILPLYLIATSKDWLICVSANCNSTLWKIELAPYLVAKSFGRSSLSASGHVLDRAAARLAPARAFGA